MASRLLPFLAGTLLLSVLLSVSWGSEEGDEYTDDEDHEMDYHNCSCVGDGEGHCSHSLGADDTFPVATLHWQEVNIPVTVGIWILFSSLARMAFSFTSIEKYIPESCILICIGFVIGLIILLINLPGASTIRLDAHLFFLYLLPPIMLEAGYFMPVRAFTTNLATILLFAVVGTLFNAITVGLSLFAVSEFGWLGYDSHLGNITKISFLECFTFSSLISAVDPVAVLAVFEEIHVNQVLYILVFGESLLNDAVTVVLYRMFETFNQIGQENLKWEDIVFGILSFFVVSLGGIIIGLIFGFLTALMSRFAQHIRVIEPVFVFIMAYMAYLVAELLSLSSIMAIVTCAMVMRPYVERNISSKSHTTIKYSMKMMSSISETIIFILLGISTLAESSRHQWNTSFVFFTILFTFIYRFLGVAWQCFLVNRYRLIRINSKEKFIMAYGGIRGAIAFSLAALLCDNIVMGSKIFFTTSIVIVMFTMFIQGTTIKPLVNFLHVKKEEKHKPSMNEEIFSRVNDHILAGMELILGHGGRYYLRESWRNFDDHHLKRLLVRDHKPIRDPKILDVYQKLTEKDATDYIKEHGTFHMSSSVSNFLRSEIGSSALMYNHSSASLSGGTSDIPMGEGVTCLDMHATDLQGIPERVKKESMSGHTEILSRNMYRPHTQMYPKISRVPTEQSLMYRSMKIQIDHKLKKRRHHHHRKSKTSLPHGGKNSTPKKLTAPTLVIHEPVDELPPQTNQSSKLSPPISPDEDEGITFTAFKTKSEDEPSSVTDIYHGEDEPDVGLPHKLSIQESSVPWKLNAMSVMPSERASEDPHDEFGNKVPTTPNHQGNNDELKPFLEVPKAGEVKIVVGGDSEPESDTEEPSLLMVEDGGQRTTPL